MFLVSERELDELSRSTIATGSSVGTPRPIRVRKNTKQATGAIIMQKTYSGLEKIRLVSLCDTLKVVFILLTNPDICLLIGDVCRQTVCICRLLGYVCLQICFVCLRL